jgi:hypothetical protein
MIRSAPPPLPSPIIGGGEVWEVVHLHIKCYEFEQVSEHEMHVAFHKNPASFQQAEYNSPVKNITEQEDLRESSHAREVV